eukprot:550560_1
MTSPSIRSISLDSASHTLPRRKLVSPTNKRSQSQSSYVSTPNDKILRPVKPKDKKQPFTVDRVPLSVSCQTPVVSSVSKPSTTLGTHRTAGSSQSPTFSQSYTSNQSATSNQPATFSQPSSTSTLSRSVTFHRPTRSGTGTMARNIRLGPRAAPSTMKHKSGLLRRKNRETS